MSATTPAPPPDELKAGSLMSRGIELLREHWVQLLVPLLLVGVLSGGGGGGDGPLDFDRNFGRMDPLESLLLLPILALAGLVALAVLVLVFFLYTIGYLMTTHATLASTRDGRPTDWSEAFRAIRPGLLPAAGTFLLWLLLVALGFVLLIVPGFVAAAGLYPIAAVVVAEGRTGMDAIKRAWELTKGHRMDTFLLVLLGIAISLVASALVGWLPLVGDVLSGAVGGAVAAFWAVTATLFYARRTGGAEVGVAPPAEPPAAYAE